MSLLVLSVAVLSPGPQQEPPSDPRRTPVVEVVERVKPAVVSISTNVQHYATDFFGRTFVSEGAGPSGTGVVIYEDGFLITNYHVIDGATQIQVRFDPADDEKTYDAALVSSIPQEDLALLKIEGDEPFHTVTLSESDPILGEPVIAIGNAFGHSHTVSTGIVSGLHRDVGTREGLHFDNLIQTDASINPGNSGGPLLDINGELIGINSAWQGTAENIGFAIPVGRVRKVLSEQLLSLSEARAWLGFEVDENTLEVRQITPGGPAEAAGLERGDRLVGLNGHLLVEIGSDVHDVYRRVRLAIQPSARVPLEVQRGKTKKSLEIVAWNKVDGILFERLGLGLETVQIGPYGGSSYLRVTSVQPGGPGDAAGIKVGDVLTTVQRPKQRALYYQRPDQLAGVVARLTAGTKLEVELWRDLNKNTIYFERDAASNYSEGLHGPLTVR